jgi:hypothetical protein
MILSQFLDACRMVFKRGAFCAAKEIFDMNFFLNFFREAKSLWKKAMMFLALFCAQNILWISLHF